MTLARSRWVRLFGIGVACVALVAVSAFLGMALARSLSSSEAEQDLSRLRSSPAPGTLSMTGQAQPVREPGVLVINMVPIRLARLSCPDPDTVAADAARRAISALVGTVRLDCDLFGRRVDGMRLGQCRLPDGTDIAARLLAEGHCRRGWLRK